MQQLLKYQLQNTFQQFQISMYQILCQYGTNKHTYNMPNILSQLHEQILHDFDELPSKYDLVYINDNVGDWMLVQNQYDFQKIFQLDKGVVLFKILASIQKDDQDQELDQVCQRKIGKIVITEQMKKMVQFVSQKYIKRYQKSALKQKISRVSSSFRRQKIPMSKTSLNKINPQIFQTLAYENYKKQSRHLSPDTKYFLIQKITKAVTCKLNNKIQQLVQDCLEMSYAQLKCKKCLKKQLEICQLIRKQLKNKLKQKDNKL